MPESLSKTEATTTDPSASKQYDSASSTATKLHDFYTLADSLPIGMLGTAREGVGPVARSMAVAKRTGPDFLFLANAHSRKMADLDAQKTVSLTFYNSSTQDWIAVTGEGHVAAQGDARVAQVYSKGVKAWFGDLGDGVHTGGPEDPRMRLVEVKATYITYWKRETGMLGFAKEVGGAILTGGVANPGVLRELNADEIKEARSKDSDLSG